jgi:hypothetical protein
LSPEILITAISEAVTGITSVIGSIMDKKAIEALNDGSALELQDRLTYDYVDKTNTYIIVGLLVFLILASTAIIVIKKT